MGHEPRRGARVNISIVPDTGGFRLNASSSVERDPGFSCEILAKSQFSFGDSVAQLRAFKDIVEDIDVNDWLRTGAALEKLGGVGNLFAYRLFGQLGLEGFCAYLSVLFADVDAQENPVLVEITAPPEMQFPFEVLPVLGPPPEAPQTPAQVVSAACAFPGFAAIIRRTVLGPALPQRPSLAMGEQLPVRLFRHGQLEAELFEVGGPFEVRGSWPERAYGSQREALQSFGKLIFDAPSLGSDCGEQVQHFACHCQTGHGEAGAWEIQLAPPHESDEIGLSLVDLLAERRKRLTNSAAIRPLVFMNACGSAAIDPVSILSLPRMFLENGNCAYIGTETKIPPEIAADISRRFYAHLLSGNEVSAGLALHRAKWELLLRHGNPSGVLYTLYGDPDVAVGNAGPQPGARHDR
jgi:hypothetical protein